MGLSVALHNPTEATVTHYEMEDGMHGSIQFTDALGGNINLFVPPHVADALKEAFDKAMAEQPVAEAV